MLRKDAIPLQNPSDFYDDWDDVEVDAFYESMKEGYQAMAEENLAEAELYFPAQSEVVTKK